jgi:dUTP pyrophosphatase
MNMESYILLILLFILLVLLIYSIVKEPANKPNSIPRFENEEEEREFWDKHDSSDYINWKNKKSVVFTKLKDIFYLNIELVEPGAKLPTRAHVTDAGLDIYAIEDVTIPYKCDKVISTGLKMEFPKGYYIQIAPKSGRSVNDKLIIGGGVIDSEYRGIVKVHVYNLSPGSAVHIKKGEKLAQLIVHKIWIGSPKEVDKIGVNTDRGSNGFGSTGLIERNENE